MVKLPVRRRAELSGTITYDPLPVGWRIDQFFLEAGSVRVRIAVDQTHDVGAISRELGAHHEADRLARLHTEAITITDDLHSTDRVAVDGRPQRYDE